MASVAEISAENERLSREIHALLSANAALQKQVMELNSERETGSEKVQTLAQELESVDTELSLLRAQCKSMTVIIENAKAQTEVEEEPAQQPPGRKISTAINHTLQRARGMSMPRQRRSSTVDKVAQGLNKAASYMTLPSGRPNPNASRPPRMNKDSPPILSYAKGTKDVKKSLLFSAHSHYGNFRRHSGPYRKSAETVVRL